VGREKKRERNGQGMFGSYKTRRAVWKERKMLLAVQCECLLTSRFQTYGNLHCSPMLLASEFCFENTKGRG
jgi:hypothetical protein